MPCMYVYCTYTIVCYAMLILHVYTIYYIQVPAYAPFVAAGFFFGPAELLHEVSIYNIYLLYV